MADDEMPENLSEEEKEAREKSPTAGSLPTWWKPNPADPPPAAAPPATLHLERSGMEAAVAPGPAAPPDSAEQYQPTMVLGTVPAPPQTASVMVRSGPDTGAKFALETSPLYVGRAPDNGIVVNDPATSRRHARFEMRARELLVVDLGSANGTMVDGVRVVEQTLADGTVITMGQNEFVVSIS
jgi:Inner membrane component of T3SS, cytoplasmic domain